MNRSNLTPALLHARLRRRRASRHKREGAALLIVLFVLMMATGTAVFAMQSTQFEQRAAGSLHQATRTKYIAEAGTVSVLALCYQLGPTGCTDLKRANSNFAPTLRERFGLPDFNTSETEFLYQVGTADMPKAENTPFPATLLPNDTELSGGGTASAYRPDFTTVMEKWVVPNPGETRERFRLIVSTFGQLAYDGNNDNVNDSSRGTGELRESHESISATRAYFDVR